MFFVDNTFFLHYCSARLGLGYVHKTKIGKLSVISVTKISLATLWLVTFVKILSISEKEWLLIRVGLSTSGYKPIEYIVFKKDFVP